MKRPISEIRQVAEGTLMVLVEAAEPPEFQPGQYFWVELPSRGFDDEKGLRRHISIVTAPTDDNVLGFATRIRDSAFKKTLTVLEVGDEIDVEEPKGSFVLPEDTAPPYVFVAGGIGITVFRSMLRFIAARSLPYNITLIYSNRDRPSTAFLDELPMLESMIPGLTVILTMTDEPAWGGETRHVDERFLRDHLGEDLTGYIYFIAGPPGMAESVGDMLKGLVPEEQVSVGKYSGY